MNLIEARYTNNKGCPWAGGPLSYCAIEDVVAIGRLCIFGDNVERCMVKTATGTGIYFVKISAQGDVERKWLAAQFKKAQLPDGAYRLLTREMAVLDAWITLKEKTQ